MSILPKQIDVNLIKGLENSDDACVYKIDDGSYLVSSLDFFSPNVKDPYTFGKIAAANALSDIFAMGAKVLYALNILSFPSELENEAVRLMLKGSYEKVNEAGGVTAGGHTTTNKDVVFGLSVTGKVDENKIYTNDKGLKNNKIILTKKLGTGIYNKLLTEVNEDTLEVIKSMETLNKKASEIMSSYNISTCTDVTGFGLTGHLLEILKSSQISANIYIEQLPLFKRTLELANNISGGMKRNYNFIKNDVNFNNISKEYINILTDPQTSGGLLILVDNPEATALLNDLKTSGVEARIIGETTEKLSKYVNVYEK